MTSLRHNDPQESPADAYLDAARACILDVGWKRTTLTEVAKRAGVSRMTIYRTWADMPTLLSDLMTREWGRVVSTRVASREGADAVEQVVEGVVAAVRSLREDELFVRIVEIDPELVLPYLFARRGRSQDLLLDLLVPALEAGQRTGEVRQAPPVALARALLLAVHGFVLSLHTMVDEQVDEAALLHELAHVVRAALRP
ncbi:TetR/AcrR family transcriptional regulator [Nocardioides flavescens]|uniref:TetR family transcriptional regulator n=1 Tax=Nocardioides flavescens TaxID=2691959 RepID=A0A6L7F2M1_9ACTN|nr:TetR/AcrR family transcriptional regulator [Nocardioides flavescens]MXG91282.1 TetR family transcriptional regulator [Nocardioides flavescens]